MAHSMGIHYDKMEDAGENPLWLSCCQRKNHQPHTTQDATHICEALDSRSHLKLFLFDVILVVTIAVSGWGVYIQPTTKTAWKTPFVTHPVPTPRCAESIRLLTFLPGRRFSWCFLWNIWLAGSFFWGYIMKKNIPIPCWNSSCQTDFGNELINSCQFHPHRN